MSLTITLDDHLGSELEQLAAESGRGIERVLRDALEVYRRSLFLDGLQADFARLRADSKAWEHELAERADWDETLADDLAGDAGIES